MAFILLCYNHFSLRCKFYMCVKLVDLILSYSCQSLDSNDLSRLCDLMTSLCAYHTKGANKYLMKE